MKKRNTPGEFERRALAHAQEVAFERNGVPVTNLDKTLLKLSTSDKVDAAKSLLQFYREAMRSSEEWRENAVHDLLAYKEYWGPEFDRCRHLNRSTPLVYPDPDDIVITSATTFRFIGPVTADEARDWQFFRNVRAAFIMVAEEIVATAGHFAPVEEALDRWGKVRRQYYRMNRFLPAIFKRKYPAKFPAFRPTAQPPVWYTEYDEWIDESGEWVQALSEDA